MNARPHRRIATLVLAAMAPALFAAQLAVAGGAGRSAVALSNPVQCIQEDMQCAKDAASGTACDPLPC